MIKTIARIFRLSAFALFPLLGQASPIQGNIFSAVGDSMTLYSVSVPGNGNYTVTMQVTGHTNPFSPTFKITNIQQTGAAATSSYDPATAMLSIPGIKMIFPGADGSDACVIFDVVILGVTNSVWALWQSNAKGYC